MPLHAALLHQTVYAYDRRVTLSPQIIRLRPAPHSRTRVLSYSLRVEPEPHFINWQQDAFSNWQARVVFPEPVDHFSVTVDLIADMAIYNPFDFFVEPDAENYPFKYAEALKLDLEPYLRTIEMTPLFKQLVDSIPCTPMRTIDFLMDLNRSLQQSIKYLIRMEPGVQTPEETLTNASGSCRDSAWLFVQLFAPPWPGLAIRVRVLGAAHAGREIARRPERHRGRLHRPARLVRGIPAGRGLDRLRSDLGLMAGEGHIPLCATPEPATAAPISGDDVVLGRRRTQDRVRHEMKVTRVLETARVTKPYTDEQWAAVDRLGQEVDAKLKAGDVRLTMGGEPTFISIDDMQGAEWNTAAVGPMKEGLANQLIRRLKDRFAPNGLLTFGQGKWYPGESLPRWAYALYWRGDGKPVVRGDLADGSTKANELSARALIRGIAERLEVNPDNAVSRLRGRVLLHAPGAQAAGRTSRRTTASSRTRRNAPASHACSRAAWTYPRATRCRSSAGRRRPGSANAGRSAAAACS
jgi:hypothetical protein